MPDYIVPQWLNGGTVEPTPGTWLCTPEEIAAFAAAINDGSVFGHSVIDDFDSTKLWPPEGPA